MLLARQPNATDWRICLLSTDPGDLFRASKARMSADKKLSLKKSLKVSTFASSFYFFFS